MCISPAKKKTQEEFAAQVEALTGKEYEVRTPYVNAFTRVRMLHRKCGREFFVAPVHFTSTGRRCPHCRGAGAQPGC